MIYDDKGRPMRKTFGFGSHYEPVVEKSKPVESVEAIGFQIEAESETELEEVPS